MTLEELDALRAREKANPRTAVMSRLVGNARCNACGVQKRETIAFDVRKDGSAAVLVCDDCLATKIALPVLSTCGECGFRHRVAVRGGTRHECEHPKQTVEEAYVSVDAPPPPWCPISKGSR